jgi:hypothetical protein
MKKIISLLLSLALVTLTARAANITFTDHTFKLSNYSETPIFKTSPSDTVSFAQCPTCGNPGKALQIRETLPTSQDLIAIGFINNTFAYNPLTQGVITSIDASVDKNIISDVPPTDPSNPYRNTFRPLIEQDGMFYLAAIPGPTFTQGGDIGYSTISQNGLVATDFSLFDFSTGTFGVTHPNFAGDAMLFGLGQLTQFGPPNVHFEADYDNLRLTIHSAVPDSGATILLLLGSVALLFFYRASESRHV